MAQKLTNNAVLSSILLIQLFFCTPTNQAITTSDAPSIAPFTFGNRIEERQRVSISCTIASGDLNGLTIVWLKDGQQLSSQLGFLRNISIKQTDAYESSIKFAPVRLEHSGNYTCVARNRAGVQTYSAQLLVLGEPRWLIKEPRSGPIVASRGQSVVIDCHTTGYPKPQLSWFVKTHAQNEFEPLAATGRISLAANGSLVIRNADKVDEANYQCRSNNGIGPGLTWTTALKVSVPAHFESNRPQTSVVRRLSQVQLRCDAFGDEPVNIEWYQNKQRLHSDAMDQRYSIHNTALPNGLISALLIKGSQRQDNSIFECLARNPTGKDRLPIELIVQEEPDNISDLQTTQVNSRSVQLAWTEPYNGKSPILEYVFQMKKLANEAGSSLSGSSVINSGSITDGVEPMNDSFGAPVTASFIASTGDDWQQAARIIVPAGQAIASVSSVPGLRAFTMERLDPSSRYLVRALAINAVGHSRFSQPMEFNTAEEPPELEPSNVRAVAINSTSIQVSWDEVPRSSQPGRILGYYIGYRLAASHNNHGNPMHINRHNRLQYQHVNNPLATNFVYKPYLINDSVGPQLFTSPMTATYETNSQSQTVQRFEFLISELRRDTSYEITVVAFNSRGSGPNSDIVICKTIEMDAPKPVRLQIRRESNESIFLEWHRDPQDQNPVDDYVIYQEKNSSSQNSPEWMQMRLFGNQTQYKADDLKCGTRYQFYMIAQNKVGKSAPSEVVSGITSGTLPIVPSKSSLIKMVNSSCLLVNLNSFQDNNCRVRNFVVRYRLSKTSQISGTSAASSTSNGASVGSGNSLLLTGSNGVLANHQALVSSQEQTAKQSQLNGAGVSNNAGSAGAEWTTKNGQRTTDENRMEYLCGLDPLGEYIIHVTAANDVGRSEIEYTVLMSSDELRPSILKETMEFFSSFPNLFAYLPSTIFFLKAALLLTLVSLVLYKLVIAYYQKFVIMQNQMRASRRAKRDERRRRKLNKARHSQKHLDLWAEEYYDDLDDDEDGQGDDEGDDDCDDLDHDLDDCGNGPLGQVGSGTRDHHDNNNARNRIAARMRNQAATAMGQFVTGHYMSNIANSAFDTSSIDSPCNGKFMGGTGGGSCRSTESTNSSIHGRFQCLNSKQYVKMNEYTMLPTISANTVPPANNESIYGVTSTGQPVKGNSSLYYSTLRRSTMQTYLPQHQLQKGQQISSNQQQQSSQPQQPPLQQQMQRQSPSSQIIQAPQVNTAHQTQQQSRRCSQNVTDMYGYYRGANQSSPTNQSMQTVDEVNHSIFVPPQQIIYSAPNIRRQPVFL